MQITRFFFVVFLLSPTFLSGYTFSQDLLPGDAGEDVRQLQILLNTDLATRITSAGPGSPGNETTYFGLLTLKSVLVFQEKYKNEILLPAGLLTPTGIIGHYSRAKLHTLQSLALGEAYSSPNTVIPSLPVPNQEFLISPPEIPPSPSQGSPKILMLSRYEVDHGMEISITGEAFDATKNNIHFSDSSHIIGSVPSFDGRTITFEVPEEIPYGSYNIWVSNKYGSSFNDSFGEYFTVARSSQISEAPSISSIRPSTLIQPYDETLVIKGNNFEKTGNTVISDFGQLENLSSSQGIITVRLSDFAGSSQLDTLSQFATSKRILTILFYVKTDMGISEGTPINLEIGL